MTTGTVTGILQLIRGTITATILCTANNEKNFERIEAMMIDELTRRVGGKNIGVQLLNSAVTDVKKIRGTEDVRLSFETDCVTVDEVKNALINGTPWDNLVFVVRIKREDFEAAVAAHQEEKENPNRKAELAKHLREQAAIFRADDPLARGAAELEEAAQLLEQA